MDKSIIVIVEIRKKADFIVGTVKALSDKYGIRNILEAVAEIKRQDEIPVKLRISGKGPQENEYHELADKLGISDITTWLGFITQKQAAVEWANMDVAIIPSTLESESFGVSAVEAQACGTAVIISDIPGLMEATKPGVTSVVVPRNSAVEIKRQIINMYRYPRILSEYGSNGFCFVRSKYEYNEIFRKIESFYKSIYEKGKNLDV